MPNMRITLSLLSIFISVSILAPQPLLAGDAANPNRFQSDEYGFQYDKPKGWTFGTQESWIENLRKAGAPEEAIKQMIQSGGNIPVSYALKHTEPFSDINPIFKINVQRMPPHVDITLEMIMDNSIKGFLQQIPNAKIEGESRKIKVGDQDSITASVAYEFEKEEGEKKIILTSVYFVMREGLLYVFNQSSPKEGPDSSQPIFDKILKTIRFTEVKIDTSKPPAGHKGTPHGGGAAPAPSKGSVPSGHPPIKRDKPAGHP